jgi:hypothetical protein
VTSTSEPPSALSQQWVRAPKSSLRACRWSRMQGVITRLRTRLVHDHIAHDGSSSCVRSAARIADRLSQATKATNAMKDLRPYGAAGRVSHAGTGGGELSRSLLLMREGRCTDVTGRSDHRLLQWHWTRRRRAPDGGWIHGRGHGSDSRVARQRCGDDQAVSRCHRPQHRSGCRRRDPAAARSYRRPGQQRRVYRPRSDRGGSGRLSASDVRRERVRSSADGSSARPCSAPAGCRAHRHHRLHLREDVHTRQRHLLRLQVRPRGAH